MLNISIWMFLGLKYFKCRYYRYLIYQIDIIFVYVKYWWGCVIIIMQLLLNADIWYLKHFSLLEIFLLHCWNVVQINKQFNNPHDTKTREQSERELERCREQAGARAAHFTSTVPSQDQRQHTTQQLYNNPSHHSH